jgi:hypothetical protein
MSTSTFVLGWNTKILGNVEIVGRPFSEVSLTKGYNKDLVKSQLTLAITYARQMLTETENLIRQALIPCIERSAGAPGPLGYVTNISPIVVASALQHFKYYPNLTQGNAKGWVELLNFLKQGYMMIGQGIRGACSIVDVRQAEKADCGGYVGYYGTPKLLDPRNPDGVMLAKQGRIHINFQWITTQTAQKVARTIIHEGSHKFIGTQDHAYKYEKAKYAALTVAKAVGNADSFAYFAYSTWKNGAYALEK